MNTRTRIYLSLGALTLLVMVIAIVSSTTIWRLQRDGRDLLQANYASIEHMQGLLENMTAAGDTAKINGDMRALLQAQQRNITESQEPDATGELRTALNTWMHERTDASAHALRASIDRVIAINRDAIVQKVSASEHAGERALLWITLTGTFCALLALSLLFGLPNQFLDPIRKLTEGIDRITQGQYRERVHLQRKDEFGFMAQRFNAMAGELERWENSNLARVMEEKARAEAVINSLRDPSIGLDDQDRILFMNQQAAELIGVQPSELVGRAVSEVAGQYDLLAYILRAQGSTTFKAVLGEREQQFTVENAPVHAGEDRIGTVYTLHNVTPYLERDQAKTMFLATISHELKTPLASTDLGLGLLERQQAAQLTADQSAIISDLRKDHQRLVRIVSELLDMAQVETGRVRVNAAAHDLNGIVRDAVDALRPTSEAKRIRVETDLGATPLIVHADAEKAVWALINLLSNAHRHAQADSTITVAGKASGTDVLLTVTDRGSGIAEAQLEHLFKRFTPHDPKGTGLGLSIAQDLMRAMQGDITLGSTGPEGTTFIMRFVSA